MEQDAGKGGNFVVVACLIGLAALGIGMLQGRQLGGGLSGGGCCGGAWGAPLARSGQGSVTAEAEKAALAYAGKKFGSGRGVTAKATDYGCHLGVDVYRDGKAVLRLAYRGNGRVEEL
ncbi:MAG: hypothetical protein ACM3ZC_04560 [Bacteroidota bacterium]